MKATTDKKEKFAAFCRMVQAKGLVFGSGGNLSIRDGEHILVTPSGRSLESLTAGDIICINPDGSYEGPGKPTSEYRMHLGCYIDRADVNVVVHVHSLYATAVSCLKDLDAEKAIPVLTPGYGKRVGDLPAIEYICPGSEELAGMVREVLRTRDSVLLRNHGVVTVGRDEETALNLAEEIEAEAQMFLLLGDRGRELSARERDDLVNYVTGKDRR